MENDLNKKININVQDKGWDELSVAVSFIILLNSTIYFLVKGSSFQTHLVNILFLVFSLFCQKRFLGLNLYRFESSKLKLATQRRKAILLGIAFRENFTFPTTRSILGGLDTYKRIALVFFGFALTLYMRNLLDFSLVSWSIGLLVIFALSPTWLWLPVLFSMFLLVVGSHQVYGARHAVTFATVTLVGIQCLIFAWFVGNRLESIRLQVSRSPKKQNGTQAALLSIVFVAIATVIFLILPKQINTGKFQFRNSNPPSSSDSQGSNPGTLQDWIEKQLNGDPSEPTFAQNNGRNSGQSSNNRNGKGTKPN